jgi:F0F1-type ATP synthase membrane subunit b/b'
MSIKLILSLLALSGLAGIALGYVLRLLIALGQRGSLELEIKQQMLEAKERAGKIIAEAEARAEKVVEEHEKPLREREEVLAKAVERLGKREEFLDERERSLSDEAEDVRNRENEAANVKREAEKLREERRLELVRLGRLSEQEARDALMKDLEESQSENIVASFET